MDFESLARANVVARTPRFREVYKVLILPAMKQFATHPQRRSNFTGLAALCSHPARCLKPDALARRS